MLRAILNKSWRQHLTKQQLCGHLPPITKTIKFRRTKIRIKIRHAGHCWRNWNELISHILLWTPSLGRAKAGQPARTYIQQLCADTGCNADDLPEAMDDREGWCERGLDIRVDSVTWWWLRSRYLSLFSLSFSFILIFFISFIYFILFIYLFIHFFVDHY